VKDKEAKYYTTYEGDKVKCELCPRACVIKNGNAGICRGRMNKNGKLYATTYGECCSVAMDPIEKKPLYHFYPAQPILSIGTIGCNLKCCFCQNWQISQSTVSTRYISPEEIVDYARTHNSIGIAYTYNEPFVWYEYVLDTAKLIKSAGLKNVLVTNGFVNKAPLLELLPYIDAMNIDVKSIDDTFYKHTCGNGSLEPVLNTVKLAREHNCWIELTNLVIPGLNDKEEQIVKLIDWIIQELGDDIPVHFSRYFPHYKLDTPATPLAILQRIYEYASTRIKYVYIGNAWELEKDDTLCPECKNVIIRRMGYTVSTRNLKDGRCINCNTYISGRW
jgi:pyruvate formate lyase activating enzyme